MNKRLVVADLTGYLVSLAFPVLKEWAKLKPTIRVEQQTTYFVLNIPASEETTVNNFRMAFGVLLIVLTFSSLAQAQASRTWVSGVGDDVNPCSRTAPCKTFAGAISKTARGGEISALDQGGFGSVTITKSITIDGTGVLASIIAVSVTGIIINITDATDLDKTVRIRGLSINGAGKGKYGILVTAANRVSVEDTVIDGCDLGINIFAGEVFVGNTTIRNNKGAGINVENTPTARVAVSDTSLIFNLSGFAGPVAKITSFPNVVMYGNKTGDAATPVPPPKPR